MNLGNKIYCISDGKQPEQEIQINLCQKYNLIPLSLENINFAENNSILVLLGGDGFLLKVAHLVFKKNISIYGINYGTFGFLLNAQEDLSNLIENIKHSSKSVLHPLSIEVHTARGTKHDLIAFNEISVLRETNQVAKLTVNLNGKTRLQELVADGIVLSTPAGSTAYNFSVGGPVISIESGLLSLSPISPFRPRHWRGALISDETIVEIFPLELPKRPISATADFHFVENITYLRAFLDKNMCLNLLFNRNKPLKEKILLEQFAI